MRGDLWITFLKAREVRTWDGIFRRLVDGGFGNSGRLRRMGMSFDDAGLCGGWIEEVLLWIWLVTWVSRGSR